MLPQALNLKIDLSQDGLNMFFEPYQSILIEYAFNNKCEFNSRQAFDYINKCLKERFEKTKSRAAIINFLNEMVEYDVLTYREETCKGGSRRIYTAHTGRDRHYAVTKHEMDLTAFVNRVGQTVYEKLHELAPDAKLVAVVF